MLIKNPSPLIIKNSARDLSALKELRLGEPILSNSNSVVSVSDINTQLKTGKKVHFTDELNICKINTPLVGKTHNDKVELFFKS